jgi:uncharacterized protein involved in exopolysaccharide biosynthesis
MIDDSTEDLQYPELLANRRVVLAHPVAWEEKAEDISVLRVANALLRHSRATIGFPIVVVVLVILFTLLLPRSFTSSAALMPQSEESALSQFASFAADLGMPLSTSSSAQSPEFYESLLRTRGLLEAAVSTEYVFATGDDPAAEPRRGTLVELYGMNDPDPRRRVEDAIDQLDEDLSTQADAVIGTLNLAVQTRVPDLSRAVAERLLELVDEFDAETRQTRAAAERVFVGSRLESARAELLGMEDSLESFLEANRRYQSSPNLRFEYERLQRRVALRQQVASSLAIAYEEARVEEVRDTPVLTVVDPPRRPVKPDSRGIVLKALVAFILALIAGSAWALGREFARSAHLRDPEACGEMVRHRDELLGQGRRVWTNVRGGRIRRQRGST